MLLITEVIKPSMYLFWVKKGCNLVHQAHMYRYEAGDPVIWVWGLKRGSTNTNTELSGGCEITGPMWHEVQTHLRSRKVKVAHSTSVLGTFKAILVRYRCDTGETGILVQMSRQKGTGVSRQHTAMFICPAFFPGWERSCRIWAFWRDPRSCRSSWVCRCEEKCPAGWWGEDPLVPPRWRTH